MSEPSDERVEQIREHLKGLEGQWAPAESFDARYLLQLLDAANTRASRLDDIIEFIRTYDPNVVDSAEAYYPENQDEAS